MINSTFDLHNYDIRTKEDLHYHLDKIIQESYDSNQDEIRIITGRGLHSKKNLPLLRTETQNYLRNNKLIKSMTRELTEGSFVISFIN